VRAAFGMAALSVGARTVLADVARSQLVKSFLLAGVEAAVEAACGLFALLGFGRAVLAQLLRQVQALGRGQLAPIGALAWGAGAWLGRDGLGILVPGCLLAGLDLQKCFQAFRAVGPKLGKVCCCVALAVLACRMGRGRYR